MMLAVLLFILPLLALMSGIILCSNKSPHPRQTPLHNNKKKETHAGKDGKKKLDDKRKHKEPMPSTQEVTNTNATTGSGETKDTKGTKGTTTCDNRNTTQMEEDDDYDNITEDQLMKKRSVVLMVKTPGGNFTEMKPQKV